MSTAALRVLSCIVCENRALAQIEVEWSTPLGSSAVFMKTFLYDAIYRQNRWLIDDT